MYIGQVQECLCGAVEEKKHKKYTKKFKIKLYKIKDKKLSEIKQCPNETVK